MPKINEYSLGAKGVNRVKSPVHLELGEVTQAQNAYPNPNAAEGGLTIRGGMSKLNTSALAGAITGLTHVPLADEAGLTVKFYAAVEPEDTDWGTTKWVTSVDNFTSIANATTPTAATHRAKIGVASGQGIWPRQILSFRNCIIWNPDEGSWTNATEPAPVSPRLHIWDGTNDLRVVTIPPHPSETSASRHVLDIVAGDGKVYFSTLDNRNLSSSADSGRVFELDLDTSTITQVGNAFGSGTGEENSGYPISLVWWMGRLWVGTAPGSTLGNFGLNVGTGEILSIRPGLDETWTSDVTLPANLVAASMAVYRGELYVGCLSTVGTASGTAKLRKRTATGTWSESATGGTNTDGAFGALAVFEDVLYAVLVEIQAPNVNAIKAFDGTSWTTAYDIRADITAGDLGLGTLFWPGMMVPIEGVGIFYLHPVRFGSVSGNGSGILRKLTGGSWERSLGITTFTNAMTNQFGYIRI